MTPTPTADAFLDALKEHRFPEELEKVQRAFKTDEGQMGHPDTRDNRTDK